MGKELYLLELVKIRYLLFFLIVLIAILLAVEIIKVCVVAKKELRADLLEELNLAEQNK